jgi:hypothetical protein
VGGAIGGIMSGAASIHATKAQEKIAKKQMKQQKLLHEESAATRQEASEMVVAASDIARQNLLATEQARMDIRGSLGSATGPISLGVLRPTGLSGLYGEPGGALTGAREMSIRGDVVGADVKLGKKPKWRGRKMWEVHGAEIDPAALAAEVKGTAGFRTVSRMVAESEQMMNRQGPLWEQLNSSVVGGIYESSAALQRSAMEQIARGIARGGGARRASLQSVEAMRVQEQVNRQRTGQLWQAKLQLEEYRVASAQQVTSFANDFVNNTAGVRDSFTNALTSLQLFWSQTMAPYLAGATVGAQSATQQGLLNAGAGMNAAIGARGAAMAGMADSLAGLGSAVGGWAMQAYQGRTQTVTGDVSAIQARGVPVSAPTASYNVSTGG